MAQQLGEIGSEDELTRALYSVDEKIIREYFQRGQLWSFDVSPVLLAVATLQAMLRSSPATHCHCYSQVVQLLEYINSECPPTGHKEAEQYIDLLVEFKTKAVLYELFEEVVVTDELKEDVLTIYLGKKSLHQKTQITYTTTKEYSELLHAYARCSLETMLASDQMCMDFRRTHLFSSENSKQINSSLLTYLSKYLSVVCERLKQAQFPHEAVSKPSETKKGIRGLTDSDTSEEDNEVASTQHVHRGSLRSRGNKNKGIEGEINTYSTGDTNEWMTDTGAQSETHGMHYNLRNREDGEQGDETGTNHEKTIPNQRRQTNKVEGNGHVSTDDSSETDSVHNLANVRYSLSPHNVISARSAQKASKVPAYVTPTQLSVRIPKIEQEGGWKKIVQSSAQEEEDKETQPQHLQQTASTIKESRTVETHGRYQLRQRQPKADASASEDTTTTVVSGRRRTVGEKHKRSASSELADSSDFTAEQESTRATLPTLGNSRRHQKPRSKRRSVVNHKSTESSEEERVVRRNRTTRQKKDMSESSNKDITMKPKRKRKQVTPRRLAQHIIGEKLMSRVHFSHCSDDEVPTTRETRSSSLKHIRSSGSKQDTEKNIGTSNTHSHQIIAQDSDSNSECEKLRCLLQSRQQRSGQLAHTSTTSCHKHHKVVNLADTFVEQSQPNSQWEYVAVQSVAAATTHPVKSLPTKNSSPSKSHSTRNPLRKRRKQMSDVASKHDHVSLVTCSSSEELLLATPDKQKRDIIGSDKLSIVSESSPGSSPIHMQPALQSIRNLRKR